VQAPVIWLTGIPASGKTTLATELKKYYDQNSHPCDILDGDEIRKTLSKDLLLRQDELIIGNSMTNLGKLKTRTQTFS